MKLLPCLLAGLKAACATVPDPRKGRGGNIAMADFGLSAFAMFFMQSASFLSFQRALEKGQGRSNCQSLFGIEKNPSDNYIRDMLDERTRRCSRPASSVWKLCWPSRLCARPLADWVAGHLLPGMEPSSFARKSSAARIASRASAPTARLSRITPCWRRRSSRPAMPKSCL
jgi:hypothetical protein